MGIIMRMKLRSTDDKVRMMAMFFNKHYISNKDSESREKRKINHNLFSIPRRILYWAKPKIVQTERNMKQKT